MTEQLNPDPLKTDEQAPACCDSVLLSTCCGEKGKPACCGPERAPAVCGCGDAQTSDPAVIESR